MWASAKVNEVAALVSSNFHSIPNFVGYGLHLEWIRTEEF